jgi:polyhydroxyalkanoate synthesis regulator protein
MRSHAVYSFHMTTGVIEESLRRSFLPIDFVHQIIGWYAYLMHGPSFNERTILSVSRDSSALKG